MPPDYSKASIYRIVFDDGRFYVGSTIVPVLTRFAQHKRAAEDGGTAKLYRNMREVGVDKVHVELVADNLGISTRDELLQIEDTYIREALRSKLCLNRNKPRATSEERAARAREQQLMWRAIRRTGDDSIPLGERVREYYRTHKRLPKGRRKKANPDELVSCECGVDTPRGRLAAHRRTKEHARDLARWLVMKKALQTAGSIPPDRPSLWDSKPVQRKR